MKQTTRKLIALLLLLALLCQGAYAAAEGEDGPQTTDVPAASSEPSAEPTGEDPVASEDPSAEPTEEPVEEPVEEPGLESTVIRVGLYYGSDALDGANLANHRGAGFAFGYYDGDNDFVQVGDTSAGSIYMVKTENVG